MEFKMGMMPNIELGTGGCEGRIWEIVGSYRIVREIMVLPLLDKYEGSLLFILYLWERPIIRVSMRSRDSSLNSQSGAKWN